MSKRLQDYSYRHLPPWLISLVIIFMLFTGFIAAYWYSAASLAVRLRSVEHRGVFMPIAEVLTFNIKLEVENRGIIPVNVRNLTARFYVENVEMGLLRIAEGFSVPAGSRIIVNATMKLEVEKLTFKALGRLASAIARRSLTLRVEGVMKVSFLLTEIPVNFNVTRTIRIGVD